MELESKVEEILEDIEDLEEDYEAGEVSKANYEAIRKRYEKELEEVKQEIIELRSDRKEALNTNKFWAVTGIIGSFIAIFSMFLPWSMNRVGETVVAFLGLEIISVKFFAPFLVIIGGVYALVGGIGILVAEVLESSLEMGGTFVLAGGIWGFVVKADISSVLAGQGVGPVFGYGIYWALVGAVIILVSGVRVS